MKLELNADRTRLHVSAQGTLDALGAEALIRQLAALRADMTPAVPDTLSDAAAGDWHVLQEDRPSITIGLRRDGTFRLSMRNRGIGWLAALLEPSHAAGLADFIRQRTAQVNPLDLIDPSDPRRH